MKMKLSWVLSCGGFFVGQEGAVRKEAADRNFEVEDWADSPLNASVNGKTCMGSALQLNDYNGTHLQLQKRKPVCLILSTDK
jgi:hypothetical protein